MKCPLCGKPRDQKYRPFCSQRCSDLDLARWLGGTYRISDSDGSAADSLAEGMDQVNESADSPRSH